MLSCVILFPFVPEGSLIQGALPVVHLPKLVSYPDVPHTHQPLSSTAHNLPLVRLYCSDAQVVSVQGDHRAAAAEVEQPHSGREQSQELQELLHAFSMKFYKVQTED